MGTCTCGRLEPPTQFNFGGKLRFSWCEAHKCGKFDTPSRWCNPMNCSNSACRTKSCALARKDFCKKHGWPCPYFNDVRCWGEPCPGGLKTCILTGADVIKYGKYNLPSCGDVPGNDPLGRPKPPPTNTPPSGGNPPPTGNCAQGNPAACFSEIGDSVAKGIHNLGLFFTDAARTGGQQLPLMMVLVAGVLLVMLVKK